MTFEELKKIFPSANIDEWHQHSNGGGWVENTATVASSAYVGPDAQVYGEAQVCGEAQVYGDAQVYGKAQSSPTLDQSAKTECSTGPYLLLLKAQVLRETLSYFDGVKGIDLDYSRYLKGMETATIEAIGNTETLDHYLRESRRITLKEWLESLDWRHCTMDKK